MAEETRAEDWEMAPPLVIESLRLERLGEEGVKISFRDRPVLIANYRILLQWLQEVFPEA